MKYFLDANVLWSITLTDFIFILNEHNILSIAYSEYVEHEALASLLSSKRAAGR